MLLEINRKEILRLCCSITGISVILLPQNTWMLLPSELEKSATLMNYCKPMTPQVVSAVLCCFAMWCLTNAKCRNGAFCWALAFCSQAWVVCGSSLAPSPNIIWVHAVGIKRKERNVWGGPHIHRYKLSVSGPVWKGCKTEHWLYQSHGLHSKF